MEDPQIREVAALLGAAHRILFITGAGISADSGLPTYRGVGGLYNDADAEEGIPIEVALSGQMFSRRPELTWKHIAQIEAACRGHTFNAGHAAIATLESMPGKEVCVLTQNVDGFHRTAGSRNVIDIHGDVHDLYCPQCDWAAVVEDYTHLSVLPPPCPACAAVIRPDVVLFGEMLPGKKIRALESELRRGFDLVFSVGTSSLFPYIAQPVLMAAQQGIPTVEINPGDTEVTPAVSHKIRGGAAASLAAIAGALGGAG
jgi:NAD-dependent deacetylase